MRAALLFAILSSFGFDAGAVSRTKEMVKIEGGRYVPFVLQLNTKADGERKFTKKSILVTSFALDRDLVTNGEFLAFVKAKPEWSRSRVKRVFADSRYLEGWRSDRELRSSSEAAAPATQVSWFAAKAYCEWRGKTLPTTDQWEFTLHDRGRNENAVRERILDWFGKPTPAELPAVGSGGANASGVRDLSVLVWEWTLDFNDLRSGDDSRDGAGERDQFCGAGGLGALDATDYAAFMRYSFRSSLKASYTTRNLGFRCAREMQ